MTVPATRGCSNTAGGEHGDRQSVLITMLPSLMAQTFAKIGNAFPARFSAKSADGTRVQFGIIPTVLRELLSLSFHSQGSTQGSPACAAPNGPVVVYTSHSNALRHPIPHGRATVA
uniref:Uncharacterized protein n=1 Tax=Ananas comosus var. bracteatus TaxID=296719 RepID=A0A6V7QLE7_ANACO|nr:unnamed protein product [Ananas comosus var. bracteatus]